MCGIEECKSEVSRECKKNVKTTEKIHFLFFENHPSHFHQTGNRQKMCIFFNVTLSVPPKITFFPLPIPPFGHSWVIYPLWPKGRLYGTQFFFSSLVGHC